MGHRSHDTPLGAILKGAVAGIVGTAAMDAVWYLRYRKGGGEQSFTEWEFTEVEDYETAPAPAQMGKRLVEGLLDVELDPRTASPMNNVVHWATGAGWGVSHGIVHGSMARATTLGGLLTGVGAWATSYGVLAPAGLYKAMWEYDTKTLWRDLTAHLAFGLGTGIVYSILSRGDKSG